MQENDRNLPTVMDPDGRCLRRWRKPPPRSGKGGARLPLQHAPEADNLLFTCVRPSERTWRACCSSTGPLLPRQLTSACISSPTSSPLTRIFLNANKILSTAAYLKTSSMASLTNSKTELLFPGLLKSLMS